MDILSNATGFNYNLTGTVLTSNLNLASVILEFIRVEA